MSEGPAGIPYGPLLGGHVACQQNHPAAPPGWPEGPHSPEHDLATVGEGFCTLCPERELVPEQPWREVASASAEERAERWGRCPCCGQLYMIRDGELWTTGGMGTVIRWPDGSVG